MFSTGKRLRLSRGQEIPIGDDVFYVCDGVIGLYSRTLRADRLVIGFTAGEVFPLLTASTSRITGRPYVYKALSKATIISLPQQQFARQLSDPVTLRNYLDMVIEYSFNQIERIDNLQEDRVLPRLAQRLLYVAYRFGRKVDGDIAITTPMSHTDLAASINCSRETVNRHMKRLQQQHILTVTKRMIRIHSLEGIQKLI